MTSRGTRYWDSGAIPLIGPDILGDIIATLADMAIVITPEGRILSVLANPIHHTYGELKEWERQDIRSVLTIESISKFDRAIADFFGGTRVARSLELNHVDLTKRWEFPIDYTLHRIGPDDAVLMLGRDLRPIAEMQQQLVKAQIALERDYESHREYDTRFQVLLGHTQDGMIFISAGAGRITEMNAAAARLLGKSRESLIGKELAPEFDGVGAGELLDRLTTAARSENRASVNLVSARSNRQLRIDPMLFRAAGERMMLCRIESADGVSATNDAYSSSLITLFESGADAVVLTDRNGMINSANEAFLNLVDATDNKSVRGRPMSEFMVRGNVDQKVLLENASRSGHMRLYTARLLGEYGGQRPVSISATHISDGQNGCFGFVMRDASLTEAISKPQTDSTADDPRPVMELVGSTPLKDIVLQTTDVVERICIETAIELTGNNRVAAAEMLGLSRQSLYVKLRKYDLLAKDR